MAFCALAIFDSPSVGHCFAAAIIMSKHHNDMRQHLLTFLDDCFSAMDDTELHLLEANWRGRKSVPVQAASMYTCSGIGDMVGQVPVCKHSIGNLNERESE